MSPRAIRACAVGYQGFGNLGDEAILCGIEQLLGDAVSIDAVVGGNRAPIPAVAGARRVTGRRVLPSGRGLRELRRADALLFSGGGLLHDHWALVVPQYLSWVLLARLLGRRVVWVGVGIGPLRRAPFRLLTALALRLSHAVLVRDQGSDLLARSLGAPPRAIIPDPAFFLAPPDDGPVAKPVRDGAGPLGLIVRAPLAGTAGGGGLPEALADVASRAWAERRQATLILTFAGARDDAFAADLAARVESRGVPVAIESLPPDPGTAMTRLGACGAIVTVRLHGMILAAVADVPCVAVAYDTKVAGVAGELGSDDLVVALDECDGTALHGALARAQEPGRQARVAARLNALRSRGPDIRATVLEALRR